MTEEEYERDKNGNYLDSITYNVIPPERVIGVQTGSCTKYFDIDTLYRIKVETDDVINPFTRQPLSDDTITKIDKYGADRVVTFEADYGYEMAKHTLKMPYYKSIGDLISKVIIASAINSRQSYLKPLQYDLITSTGESLYLMNLTDEVSTFFNRETLHSVVFENFESDLRLQEGLNHYIQYLEKNLKSEYGTNNMLHYCATQIVQSVNIISERPEVSPIDASSIRLFIGNDSFYVRTTSQNLRI